MENLWGVGLIRSMLVIDYVAGAQLLIFSHYEKQTGIAGIKHGIKRSAAFLRSTSSDALLHQGPVKVA